MDMYFDGYVSNETKKEKKNFLSIKKDLLIRKLNKNNDVNYEELIFNQFKKASKNLKNIEEILKLSTTEYKTHKTTYIPVFLWQKKLINNYRIFGIILGLIDGYMNEIQGKINFEKNFDNQKEIIKLQKQIDELLSYKDKILSNYENVGLKNEPNIINNSLYTNPTYNCFKDFYDDSIDNSYQLDLQIQFISFYNIGYTAVGKIDFYKIFKEYENTYNEIISYNDVLENNNKNKVKKKSAK